MKKKVINFNCTKSLTIETFFIPLLKKLLLKKYKVNIICSQSNNLKKYFKKNDNIFFYEVYFPKNLKQIFNPFF